MKTIYVKDFEESLSHSEHSIIVIYLRIITIIILRTHKKIPTSYPASQKNTDIEDVKGNNIDMIL